MTLPQALSERSQSLARTFKKHLSINKASEVAQFKPVALAGSSNKFQGPSKICNAFAAKRCTPSTGIKAQLLASDEEAGTTNCQYVLLIREPAAPRHGSTNNDGESRACRMCAQAFLQSHTSAHRYPEFCSLDCKSAFLFGANVYRETDETESSTVSACSDSIDGALGNNSRNDSSRRRRPCRQWV